MWLVLFIGAQLELCAGASSLAFASCSGCVLYSQAERGKMKYIIGNGKNRMDFTYVGNVAQAHLQAADALALGSKLAGQAYFITNQVRGFLWHCSKTPDWVRRHQIVFVTREQCGVCTVARASIAL